MKIGIDVTSLIYQRGVSRYTSNLVKALTATNNQLSLYGNSLRQHKFLKQTCNSLVKSNSNVEAKIQRLPPSVVSMLWDLKLKKIKSIFPNLDVFHSWDWLQPPDKNLPLVSTIHDLAILKYPDQAHPKIVKAHQKSWKQLKQKQAHIIAVSQATKKDIIKLLNFPSWRVHVVAEALPEEMVEASNNLTEPEAEQIKTKLNLIKPYILFVGVQEPRKNLDRLIKAWLPLSKEVDLLIAGAAGWSSEPVTKNPNLRFLGHVSNKELSVLYSEAELLAYPSIYEGFGLPILEAFHHGTPVVTSDISATIEVAGNAAELVDPFDIDSIQTGLKNILNESSEEQKKRLQRMIIRKQMFSWQKVALQTIKVYQKAIQDFADRSK